MALIIRANNKVDPLHPDDPREGLSIEQIKAAIGGGYMELVDLGPIRSSTPLTPTHEAIGKLYPDGHMYLVVDEDGQSKGLPLNKIATTMYWAVYAARTPIVGDALLCVMLRNTLNSKEMEVVL